MRFLRLAFQGNPEYARDLYPADFVAIARGAGIEAIHAAGR
ncbi:MAG: hypothetical protein WCF30_15175 [Terracidiphilus sp.]